MTLNADWLIPEWPAPPAVRAVVTTRAGGVSPPPFDSMNLGMRSGDAIDNVRRNRALLRAALPAEPVWLRQVHGTRVVDAASVEGEPEADGAFSRQSGVVCAVMLADCMPVLLCDRDAGVVAAAHAGWRGLSGGVIEAAVAAMNVAPGRLIAWLGPAIGPRNFEVGADVLQAFLERDAAAQSAFTAYPGRPGKWLCDLYSLARQRLAAIGVHEVSGGGACTVDDLRLYSHRRDRGGSGRMAALIWIE